MTEKLKTSRQIPFVLWIFVMVFFLLPSQVVCKTINQKGITCKYNFKGKKTTPLGGVLIKVASANAVKSDSETGEFILVFKDGKMGNHIDSVKFIFGSMMLFNQQAVDEWNIRNEPLKLILCEAADLEQEKQKYIRIGRGQVQKKYDRKFAEIESKYKNDLNLFIDKNQELAKERDSLLAKIENYAEKLARVDRSAINDKMQEVMDLYEGNDVENALKTLDGMNLLEKYKKAVAKKQLGEKIAKEAQEDSLELYKNLCIELDLRLNGSDLDGALAILEAFANEGEKAKDFFKCGLFCIEVGYEGKGIHYLEKARNAYKSLAQQDPLYQDSVLITSCLLTHLYSDNNQPEECESICREILEKYQNKLVNDFKKRALIADLNIRLALMCYYKHNYDESGSLFKKAIKDYRQLSMKGSKYKDALGVALITYANTLYIPGMVHGMEERVDREHVIPLYNEAIAIYRDLAKNDNLDNEEKLADALFHVACGPASIIDSTLINQKDLLSESLMIYKKLAHKDPDKFEICYIGRLFQLTQFVTPLNPDDEVIYRDIIDICLNSTSKYKSEYGIIITLAYAKLANDYIQNRPLYAENWSCQEAIKRLKESVDAFEKYNVKNRLLLINIAHLAKLYKELGQDSDSDLEYKRAMELSKDVIDAYKKDAKSRQDEIFVGEVMTDIAQLNREWGQYEDFEKKLKEAINYYEEQTLYFLDKDSFWILGVKEELATYYRDQKRYDDTEKQYIEIIEGNKRLFKRYRGEGSEWFISGLQYAYPAVNYIDSLACLYEEMGQYKKAEEQYNDGIRMWREMAGIRPHYISDVAKRLEKLADLLYWKMQEYEKSEKEYREAYSIRCAIFKGDIKSYFVMPDFDQDYTNKEELCSLLLKLVYNNILLKNYVQALKDAEETLVMGVPLELVERSLALAKLFNGQYQEVEKLSLQFNDESKNAFISDLRYFVDHGTAPEEYLDDIDRIIKKLKK